jgi:glycosyltransferase involved in cell wall biosynthesis
MKVVLIYRRQRAGVFSIEELFHAIAGELRKQAEVVEYETGARWRIPIDVWRLRKMRADIYHVTGDVHYFVPLLPRGKTVLTVCDINHYLNDLQGIKRRLYKWLWVLWPIRAARAVTAISGETRENLVNHLGFNRNRIEIIECCHSALFQPVSRSFNSACPVILQVGTRPHKNVPRLIEALRGVRCRLILIGRLDGSLEQKLSECGVDYRNHVNLTHEELCREYVACDLVTFVSLAEGFGVPIIEAQASGRPLITADVSPMREVAGDGACLVDPLDAAQIRAGILRIITDSDYRGQLVERGLRNVVRYSPDTISGQYLDVYRRLAGQ